MTLQVDAEAIELGFDAGRLARISGHFRRYVDDGRLPGWLITVARGGQVVHHDMYGMRDIEAGAPVTDDTLFRWYSMTKAITSVAAMMLYEEGRLDLTDPVAKYIPSIAETRVYVRGPAASAITAPQQQPMTVWNLMTHTAGFTYGFMYANGIDHLYRQAGFEWGSPAGMDLAACCDAWARLPLAFQPGAEWNYSVATDVLGRVVEVVAGMPLDEFITTRVVRPLGMTDACFHVDEADHERLAALYVPAPGTRQATRMDLLGEGAKRRPDMISGGGGLVGTAGDYHRFVQMLARGGELDGVRLLGSRTVEFMASNHLPGGADLQAFGRPLFAETSYAGVGFGLGFAVTIDPVKTMQPCSRGEFTWGGAASTVFWVDPLEDITVEFFTQLLPSSTHPIRTELRRLVYSALVD